jgi:hypothetical protein
MLTVRGANADLADAAVALTTILSTHPEQLELHIATRTEEGRRPWQSSAGMDTTDLTAVLVGELHALIRSSLHALRTAVITAPDERLATYEAIDLASRRAASATDLIAHPGSLVRAAT